MATEARYLNDSTEFRHGLSLIEMSLKKSLESASGEQRSRLEEIRRALAGLDQFNVFVASFSENADVLSQWRAYAGGPGGFAIGFRSDGLRDIARAQQFFLGRCRYNPVQQSKEIGELIEEFYEIIGRCNSWETNEGLVCIGLTMLLALTLKHETFAEEVEWRLVSPFGADQKLQVRRGPSMPLPYFEFPLTEANLCIHSVVVGPTPHPELSARSVELLLRQKGLNDPMVVQSKIPFRAW